MSNESRALRLDEEENVMAEQDEPVDRFVSVMPGDLIVTFNPNKKRKPKKDDAGEPTENQDEQP